MNVFSNLFSQNMLSKRAINMLPDAVLVITTDGKIRQSNKRAQELFSMSDSELKRQNISNMIEGALLVIDTVISTGKVQAAKTIIEGNRLLYLEINAKMQQSIEEDSTIVVSLRDVTEAYIQNAEIFGELEELKDSSSDKNEFLINVSNDLQAPLHSAVGFSQALLENLGGELNEKQKKYISIIYKNTNELLSVFNKIITLSKFEKSSITVESKNFDLIELLNNNINTFKQISEEKNLTFSLNYENLIRRNCYMDDTLLKTMFSNIFDAIVKNSASSNIEIELQHPAKEGKENSTEDTAESGSEKENIIINISVTNFGVPENELDLIMNPYAQAKRENKKYLETALSFAIAKKISQFLSGNLAIQQKGIQGIELMMSINLGKAEIK